MAKISGGANSFLLRALVQAIVDEKAIPVEKVGPVISRFKEHVNATDIAKRNPAEVLRHVGEVVARLHVPGGELPAGAEMPKVEMTQPEPTKLPPLVDLHAEVPVSELALSEAERGQTDVFKKVGDDIAAFASGQVSNALQGNAESYPPGLRAVARATEAAGIAVPPFTQKVDLALDPADIDLMLDDVDAEMPPSPRSALQAALEEVAERFSKNLRHPFIESLTCEGKRYVVVGTATIHSVKREGVARSANCTAKNYRRIKDADESILVHVDGRPVCATRELENGVCFVWLLHHTPGLAIRFWLNESDNGKRQDNPKGTYRITLVDDATGWKKAA